MAAFPALLVPLTRSLFDQACHLSRTGKGRNLGRHALNPGMAVALVRGSDVLGAGGIALYSGRLQAWMLVSRDARKRDIVAGVRLARRWLDNKARDLRCVEIYIAAESPWRKSFAQALGLKDAGRTDIFPEIDGVMCLYLKTVEGLNGR